MSQAQTAEPQLNKAPGRELWTYSGILEAPAVDKHGNPMTKSGKPMPSAKRVVYHLQDGCIFDEKGLLLAEGAIPQKVRDWRDEAAKNRPTAGITVPGSELRCSVPGCRFVTCSEVSWRGHMACHEMPEPVRKELITKALANRPRANAGDFLDPRSVLAGRQGAAGPAGTVAQEE